MKKILILVLLSPVFIQAQIFKQPIAVFKKLVQIQGLSSWNDTTLVTMDINGNLHTIGKSSIGGSTYSAGYGLFLSTGSFFVDSSTLSNKWLRRTDTTLLNLAARFSLYQPILTNPVTGTGGNGYVTFWNGTNSQSGSSNLFWDNSNYRLGIGTNVPTVGLTLATGYNFSMFNTSALTGNFESANVSWASNVFQIKTYNGGTGSARSIQILTGTNSIYYSNPTDNWNGKHQFSANTSTANSSIFGIAGTQTQSSGVGMGVSQFITSNQSGTAYNIGHRITYYNQGNGSGTNYFARYSTNTAANGAGTDTWRYSVDFSGNVIANSFSISGPSTSALMADGSTQTLTSGTYTPTISNLVNCSSVVTTGSGVYTRVGNIVNFTCSGLMTTSATGSNASFMFTPPIAFTSLNQYVGIICINPNGGTQSQAGQVVIPSSGTTIEATFPLPSTTGDLASWTLTIQYTL